jgi:hypothetical protein
VVDGSRGVDRAQPRSQSPGTGARLWTDGADLVTVAVVPFGYDIEGTPVDINGVTGAIGAHPSDGVVVTWELHGNDVYVRGHGVSEEDVLLVARGITVDEQMRVTSATAAPAGMSAELLALPEPTLPGAGYEFVKDDQRLGLVVYPGGRSTFVGRTWGDGANAEPWHGNEAALMDYGEGRYRLTVGTGLVTYEFDGASFDDVDSFRDVVDSLRFVDSAPPVAPTEISPSDAAVEATATTSGMPAPAGK